MQYAVIWASKLACVFLIQASFSFAIAADDLPVEDVTSVTKSRENTNSIAGVNFKVDDLRIEFGPFADNANISTDTYLHGAVSVKGKSGAWEFVLGGRLDTYAQTGTPGFVRTQLDYTENYLRWRGDNTRITAGTQNVLWGRVDEISPIDRMSRSDLSRSFLGRLPERRRAVPALRLEHFAGDYKVDAVWLPIFDAAVMPHQSSAWSPLDRINGRMLGIGNVPALIGAQVREEVHGSGGGGVRLTRTGAGLDYGLSLQRIRQSQPYYQMSPALLTAIHPFSWVLGGELETQKAGATWRMEATWSSDAPVTTRSFQYRTEQALDLVLGTEFFPGDSDTRVTLQVAAHKIFVSTPTLDRSQFYALTGEVEHPFAQGRWRANFRFISGLDKHDVYLNPKLTYTGIDQHEFFLAAHVFSGSPQTLGGYYKHDDLIVLGWQAKF